MIPVVKRRIAFFKFYKMEENLIPWEELIPISISRDVLCDRLIARGDCAERSTGMKLIAVATRRGLLGLSGEGDQLKCAKRKEEQVMKEKPRAVVGLGELLKSKKPIDNYNNEKKEEELNLSTEQKTVVQLVEQGENVFFTGSAGVGKSFLLKHLVKREMNRRGDNRVYCTSLTGLASCNIDGITIFSFAGIGLGKEDADVLVEQIIENRTALRRWRLVELLFIDEVSMLDATLFEKLELIARKVRNSSAVFGGIQICLSGDFFQLPPIGLGKDLNVRFCFVSVFFFFKSKVMMTLTTLKQESSMWNLVITSHVVLTTIYRQKEERFITFLNNFRKGIVDRVLLLAELSKERKRAEFSLDDEVKVEPTTLFARNVDVVRYLYLYIYMNAPQNKNKQ